MSEATNLVPELHLMEKLSPSWRKRFNEALSLIHNEKELTWQEVADRCAISSSHFLRMFSLVFNETPGHYKARMRLQRAVSLLIDHDDLSMTDIAHEEGYSSSQSLAKALKRELGYSAKEIRKMSQNIDQIQPVLNKLGHPQESREGTLEAHIALAIPFKIIKMAERYFQVRAISPPSFNACFELWNKTKPERQHSMINLASIDEWDYPLAEQTLWVGYEVSSKVQSNQITLEGNYLHCRVILESEISYFSVWDAFLNYSITHDIELLENSLMIEEVHNPEQVLTDASDISFYVAIKDAS